MKSRAVFAIYLLASIAAASLNEVNRRLLSVNQCVNFDDDQFGDYTDPDDDFQKDWGMKPYSSLDDHLYIVSDPLNGTNKVLEVAYSVGEVGGKAGMAFTAPLNGSYEHLFFQYNVMLPTDFDPPNKGGGKLPGLASDEEESGCVDNTDGFSARYMWRYYEENPYPELYGYFYYPAKKEDCGDYFELNPKIYLTYGQSYTVTQEVQLNTVGVSDGYIKIWVDQQLVLYQQKMQLRTKSDVMIAFAEIDAFPGGSDVEQWAFKTPQYTYFDNFAVSESEFFTASPTLAPIFSPSQNPTFFPTNKPTIQPTGRPSLRPTISFNPTSSPSFFPTVVPSISMNPTTREALQQASAGLGLMAILFISGGGSVLLVCLALAYCYRNKINCCQDTSNDTGYRRL